MSSESSRNSISQTPEEILKKLRSALGKDGDFPARTGAVLKVKTLAGSNRSSVNEIASVIKGEFSLSPRLLHLVNSAFYGTTKPITTITDAILRIGMSALTDLFAGVVLMQRFIPTAKRGGAFSNIVKKSVLISLISSKLAKKNLDEAAAEQAYLAGTFLTLGQLMLAYYFPQVYETAALRAKSTGERLSTSVNTLLGIYPDELSLVVMDALKIPDFYREIVESVYHQPENNISDLKQLSEILRLADRLADIISFGNIPSDLTAMLKQLEAEGFSATEELLAVIHELPGEFRKHCEVVDMNFLTISEELSTLSLESLDQSATNDFVKEAFTEYASELEQAIKDNLPFSSIITLAMEALLNGLRFQRVLLLLMSDDKQQLKAKLSLGYQYPSDTSSLTIPIDDNEIINRSLYFKNDSRSVGILNEPIFEDANIYAALPIGHGAKFLGIIYADLSNSTNQSSTSSLHCLDEIQALSQLIERAASQN
jgi:HD-like signal output (HDOD) protein